MKKILLSVLIVLASIEAFAVKTTTEWQWSTLVRNSVENAGITRAFLWIPPNCKRIRGVVVAQHNMEEISILENLRFRKELSEIGFAEVWTVPFFDHLFRFNQGADLAFNGMMEDLAALSGYSELNEVPVVPIGHSAAASWPYYFAAWNPDRTLAAISVSGQWPYFRHAQYAPDIWGGKNIDFVPCLETMGEYEAAATWSTEGLKERKEHPLMPLSMLACPAEGHFANSDKKAAFLAFYIKKAIQYRFPKEGTMPFKLMPINPSRTGWLAEKWLLGKAPTTKSAPVGSYKGDTTEAFWFFDEETVRAVEAYQKAYRNLKPQLVGFVQDGKMIPQRNSHLQVHPTFKPFEDGMTFQLSGAFYDTVPAVSGRLTDWTKLAVGSTLGHASGSVPVSIDRICGPFRKLNSNTFKVSFDRSYNTKDKRVDLVLKATHPGDKAFKQAVQQASMTIPLNNSEGMEQQIDFQKIADQKVSIRTLTLKASTDSNLPVQFYILEGPAEIRGNRIVFTKIPPRSKFPVKVTAVAWQYGRNSIPKVKTAEQVMQSFYLRK